MALDDETPYAMVERLKVLGESRDAVIAQLRARGLSDHDIGLLVGDPPKPLPAPAPAPPRGRGGGGLVALCMALAMAPFMTCGAVLHLAGNGGSELERLGPPFWMLGTALLCISFFLFRTGMREMGSRAAAIALFALVAAPSTLFARIWGGFGFLLKWDFSITSGRPLRRKGKSVLASSTCGAGWNGSAGAEFWRELALTEHASVAAFHRLSAQLVSLGASKSLRDASDAAATDEARHAKDAFEIAGALGGAEVVPGPLPTADLETDLASLIRESVRDGVVGEGVAAELARQLTPVAESSRISEFMKMVAVDEQKHAELAWEILRWAAERGGPAVIAQMLEDLEERPLIRFPPDGLEAVGIPCRARWLSVHRAVVEQTRQRVSMLNRVPGAAQSETAHG